MSKKKQTKRSRKFESKGGVKGVLDRGGTLAKKGKVRKKNKKRAGDGGIPGGDGAQKKERDAAGTSAFLKEQERQEKNFTSESNLGDLDMDSFFESFEEGGAAADTYTSEGLGGGRESKKSNSDSVSTSGSSGSESSSDDDNDKGDRSDRDEDSSSSSNSDKEEEEEEEEQDVAAASQKMKDEMQKLSRSDPDFYQFLQENEKSLLEFDNNDEDDDEEEAATDEKEKDATRDDTKKNDITGVTLTPKLLESLKEGAFQLHSLKSLKKIVAAYKTACHLSDEEPPFSRYVIDDSEVFDQLMASCLEHVHEEIYHHLLLEKESSKQNIEGKKENDDKDDFVDVDKPLHPKVVENAERWKSVKPILESFFKSTLHLLENQAKEPKLLALVLQSLSYYMRYMVPFPKLAVSYLTTCTSLWSAPDQDDYQVVRLQAFLRIRQLALTQPFPFIETCLKKTYLAYAKRCKFVSESALPTITFLGNCLVELYGLDWHSSYQHAFVYIRQLALHLRTAMQKKTPETIQAVYCWQFVNCLKLWTAILVASSLGGSAEDSSKHNKDDSSLMQSLLYPLVEVILGVVRLIPTSARHVPLQLHCVSMLQRLAAAFECYIPTSAILLQMLDYKEVYLRPKKISQKGSIKGIHLPLLLKLPKEAPLRTKEQLEAVMSLVFVLLNREVDLYRYSAGFPEFRVAICQRLRKFAKKTKNGHWRAYAKACIETCDSHAQFCIQKRSELQEAPKDVKILEVLKPPGQPNMYERHEASVQKEMQQLSATAAPLANNSASGSNYTKKRKVQEEEQEDEKVEDKPIRKKTKKTKRTVNESDLKNLDALEQDDEVEEGINWSDDDESD